jgi:hypothetical protein
MEAEWKRSGNGVEMTVMVMIKLKLVVLVVLMVAVSMECRAQPRITFHEGGTSGNE